MAAKAIDALFANIDIVVRGRVREQSTSNHHVELAGNRLDQLKARIKHKIPRSKRKR